VIKVYNTDPKKPLYLDHIRLEKDLEHEQYQFPGLVALDLGGETSLIFYNHHTTPTMRGFTALTPSMLYTKERGFGLLNPKFYGPKAMDGFQPDPLYRGFIILEGGGVAIDVPNGKYHVFLNIDSPTGFWGEFQAYSERKVLAEGKVVVHETMDIAAFRKWYFRHYDTEDMPGEDFWAKYVKTYFHEKSFDVEVTDGQLNIDFEGKQFANCVSMIVVYPADKSAQGERFLAWVEKKRRAIWNRDFKFWDRKVVDTGFLPTKKEQERGMAFFHRDLGEEVYYNDKPAAHERVEQIANFALAGESVPLEFSILPLKDLGKTTVTISALVNSNGGVIPPSAVETGYASSRVTPTSYFGTIYSLKPKYIMPRNNVMMPAHVTRRFFLMVEVPATATPGLYTGQVTVTPTGTAPVSFPVALKVHHGVLATVDIPVGPFGCGMELPWLQSDPATQQWKDMMMLKTMTKLRECGFTTVTGLPGITYKGFVGGKPVLDFSVADKNMKIARSAGFTLPTPSYYPFKGLDIYYQDTNAMQAAGFTDYAQFIRAVFTAVQKHADEQSWLPVWWVLGDEPAGPDLLSKCLANVDAYRKAFPDGPPRFTLLGSYSDANPADLDFKIAKALHCMTWGVFSQQSVDLLRANGGALAQYNGGNRWTFGDHLYKMVTQYDLQFRVAWHWNIAVGDPYYGLDCRENDYCWCNVSPDDELVSTIFFLRLRMGLNDYRGLLTLSNLIKKNPGVVQAATAQKLIDDRLATIKVGSFKGFDDDEAFRLKVEEAIESLQGW